MHAIELLLDDHETVAALFERVRSTGEGVSSFAQIRKVLESIQYIEEKLFYPALMSGGDEQLQTAVRSALEDHRQVSDYLKELADLTGDEAHFAPRLKVMMEDFEHHADDEEETMFPLAEDQLDEGKLEELGNEMERQKGRFLRGDLEFAPA